MSQFAPFVVVPPFTSCETSIIVYGQGSPPYNLYPIQTGSLNATSLEAIPLQKSAGAFYWNVDLPVGSNVTWVVIDALGATGFSSPRAIQPGNTICGRNDYSTRGNSSIGEIVGAVVGVLFVVSLLIGVLLFRRRRQKRSSNPDSRNSPKSADVEETVFSSLQRIRRHSATTPVDPVAGTFNLHSVDFTQGSLDQIRLNNAAPPAYGRYRKAPEATPLNNGGTSSTVSIVSPAIV